jgi:hypothetical protein
MDVEPTTFGVVSKVTLSLPHKCITLLFCGYVFFTA